MIKPTTTPSVTPARAQVVGPAAPARPSARPQDAAPADRFESGGTARLPAAADPAVRDPALQHDVRGHVDAARLRGPRADRMGTARDRLRHSSHNWVIGADDARAVSATMNGMSAGDKLSMLRDMDREGLLAPYLKNLPAEDRAALVDDLARGGALRESDGAQTRSQAAAEKAGPGAPRPPVAPKLVVNDKALPVSLRNAITDTNTDRVRAYHGAQRGYLEKYQAAAEAAPTTEALRGLGHPVDVQSMPHEPGVKPRSTRARRYAQKTGHAPSLVKTMQTVDTKRRQFKGERPPGTFHVGVEGGVSVDLSAKHEKKRGGVAFSGEVKVRSDKVVEGEGKAAINIEGPGGIKYKGAVKTDGKSVTTNQGLEAGREADNKDQAAVKGVTVGVDQNGKLELGADLGVATVGSSADPKNAEMEVEVGKSFGKEDSRVKAEVKAKFGMKGITAQEAKEAIESKGFFRD